MRAKYAAAKLLSLAVSIIPVFLAFSNALAAILLGEGYPVAAAVPSIAIAGLCLIAKKPIDGAYYRLKELNDLDEFGQKKKKNRYSYSKEQQDLMDLQRMADMERIVPKSVLDKMTKPGSKDPDADMEALIGLAPVKQKMREMVARMEFEKEAAKDRKRSGRKKGGDDGQAISSRHMVFFGPPGTGKTTVARILAGFLHRHGYIAENKCVETDGNFLKAGTPADTATKVKYIIRRAFGGVLFVDEAYALMDDGSGCGREAIATLIKEMEDHRGAFVLVMAGYTDEMHCLLEANPGFHSRIKEYIDFPPYTDKELCSIFRSMAKGLGMAVDKGAYAPFVERMRGERLTSSFGNARTVRNVLDETIDRHALNLMEKRIPASARYKVMAIDVDPAIGSNRI